ncbi:ghrelin O-acyltransferase [Rhinophrynus dorsalis]
MWLRGVPPSFRFAVPKAPGIPDLSETSEEDSFEGDTEEGECEEGDSTYAFGDPFETDPMPSADGFIMVVFMTLQVTTTLLRANLLQRPKKSYTVFPSIPTLDQVILDEWKMSDRYIYLLVGGLILACKSMGPYSIILFIPALVSIMVFHIVSWQTVHWWAFTVQMAWQTACHLWILYKEYFLQEAITIRLSITIASLMLLTQKITSLALDLHEGKGKLPLMGAVMNGFRLQLVYNILVLLSYFLFFPALLGGPLCSFVNFQHQVNKFHGCNSSWSIWMVTKGCLSAFFLQVLKALVSGTIGFHCTLMDCRQLNCVYIMWTTALLFKLTYYSHWLLDESLFRAAGFLVEHQRDDLQRTFSDFDIWTLETTPKISVFARTWNTSTAKWLKRLIFQQCKIRPLLMTFAFSAWWHGLYPGQIFGFLSWAMMVEADYRIHTYLDVNCQICGKQRMGCEKERLVVIVQ